METKHLRGEVEQLNSEIKVYQSDIVVERAANKGLIIAKYSPDVDIKFESWATTTYDRKEYLYKGHPFVVFAFHFARPEITGVGQKYRGSEPMVLDFSNEWPQVVSIIRLGEELHLDNGNYSGILPSDVGFEIVTNPNGVKMKKTYSYNKPSGTIVLRYEFISEAPYDDMTNRRYYSFESIQSVIGLDESSYTEALRSPKMWVSAHPNKAFMNLEAFMNTISLN